MKYEWWDPWAGTRKGGDVWGRGFPRVSIIPGIFDGGKCPVEARGCRMMGDQ